MQLKLNWLVTPMERANMHCQGIELTISFDKGSTTPEGQKLECFK
jgi:hypothetical protein